MYIYIYIYIGWLVGEMVGWVFMAYQHYMYMYVYIKMSSYMKRFVFLLIYFVLTYVYVSGSLLSSNKIHGTRPC